MSKIICDVCGTSYQDSAMQCPICGCARPVDMVGNVATDETKNARRENYTYVKGGRFSKANVQKRNSGVLSDNHSKSRSSEIPTKSVNNKGDKGLVIAVCALLLAIIAVVIYIAIHFFAGSTNDDYNHTVMQESTTSPVETTHSAEISDIPCTTILLSQSEVTLKFVGDERTLSAILTPNDTTDELLFSSSNKSVVTVSDSGNIVAVAAGEAIITVTCGDAIAECRVLCSFSEDPTDVVTAPTVVTDTYVAPYKINKTDVSISVGEAFQLKLSDANGELIPVIWTPTVTDICSIDGNTVTGQMKGKVEISTIYADQTYTCIVRVR